MPLPKILTGLREIATDYDALVCDVWGVLHDGQAARPDAVDALKKFRETRGRVVLLSNAPRPKRDVETMFRRLGVALDCYDEIVTSGIAARADLETRKPATMFHLGPDRDRGIFEGLGIALTDIEKAEIVLNSGLLDDDVETPQDYKERLARMKARGLLMLCANPDWVVQRGGKLIHCAGALANEYEKIGGEVVYYGKPMTAIYEFRAGGGARRQAHARHRRRAAHRRQGRERGRDRRALHRRRHPWRGDRRGDAAAHGGAVRQGRRPRPRGDARACMVRPLRR